MISLINSLYLADPTRSSKALNWTSDPTNDFWHHQFGVVYEKDKSLFSSRNKWSLSSYQKNEHHDIVVSLCRIDGISCKDPLTEAYLPATKAGLQCLPPQMDERTKFGGQIKSHRRDLAKNVIVLLWVDNPGHE